MGCRKSLAGRLRHKITVQVKTVTRGATGEVVEAWASHLTVRASVEPLIGREYYQAMQEQSENKVKFRVRYSSALDALNPRDHRISWKSNIYDIESKINVFEQNKEIILMASLHNG
jgi:SPP1 family predicted phage head-tail adaptor